jgi:Tfp pilus assembly protein PilF
MTTEQPPRRKSARREKGAAFVAGEGLQPLRARHDLPVLAGCLLATLLALWPVCGAEFTSWDDAQTVAKNPWLLADDALTHFWAHPYMDLYIPVTYDMWAAVASGAQQNVPGGLGLDPHAFHAANLLAHLISTALVYALLRRFVGWAPAAAGTLLFGLHPVQVEPVAWVSGMKDVLCGMLCLAALWADPLASLPAPAESPDHKQRRSAAGHTRGRGRAVPLGYASRDTDGATGHVFGGGLARYGAATLLFALSVLAKPTAMVLPAIVVVLAWASRRLTRAALVRLGPWFLISLACAAWTSRFQDNPPPMDAPLWMRPVVALHALGFYAVKLLWPVHLAVDYGCSPAWLRHHPGAWALGLIPVALAGTLLFRKRDPVIAAAAAVFVIGLSPILGLVTFDFQFFSTVADHYLYLPMFGAALALAAIVAMIARKTAGLKPPARAVLAGLIPLIAVALGVRSWFQAWSWRDSRTLFEHTLAVNPNSLAALNAEVRLALAAHQPLAAEGYARRALAVRPDYPDAIVALGSALAMEGREDDAREQFQRAVQISPDSPDALVNLGIALAKRKQLSEAESLFSRAVQVAPENAQAHLQLGTVYLQQRQVDASLHEFELATRLDPQDAQAHANLGWLLIGIGQADRAREQFQAALAIDPNLPPAVNGMRKCESMEKR